MKWEEKKRQEKKREKYTTSLKEGYKENPFPNVWIDSGLLGTWEGVHISVWSEGVFVT